MRPLPVFHFYQFVVLDSLTNLPFTIFTIPGALPVLPFAHCYHFIAPSAFTILNASPPTGYIGWPFCHFCAHTGPPQIYHSTAPTCFSPIFALLPLVAPYRFFPFSAVYGPCRFYHFTTLPPAGSTILTILAPISVFPLYSFYHISLSLFPVLPF